VSDKIVHFLPLSHHHEGEHYRCVLMPLGKKRRLALCARCLTFYPTLALVLGLQIAFDIGPAGVVDWWIALALAAPAVIDWGIGRLRHRGRNSIRLLTGALLGVALGRSLLLYFREPTNEIFWVQAGLVVMSALAFEGVRRLELD